MLIFTPSKTVDYHMTLQMHSYCTWNWLTEIIAQEQIDGNFFPTCGQKQMVGHLISCGYRVQQARVRKMMRRIDPKGSVMRQLRSLNRRQYSVLVSIDMIAGYDLSLIFFIIR